MLNLLQERQTLQESSHLRLLASRWILIHRSSILITKECYVPKEPKFDIIFKFSPLENSQQSNLLQMGYSRPPWNKTIVVNLNKYYFLFITKQF